MIFIKFIKKYIDFIKVGFFLGIRQIRRGNIWINLLIISIMSLTFLSLVVIPGILTGLTEGSFKQNREHLTGDVYLTTLANDNSIVNTQDIIKTLDRIPEITNYSVRYQSSVTVTSGYINRDDFTNDAETIGINAYAIDPEREELTTSLSSFLVEGEMLEFGRSGDVLIGATLLEKYSAFSDMFEPLRHVEVGKPIRLTFQGDPKDAFAGEMALLNPEEDKSGITMEFNVRGILDSKVGEIASGVFITEQDYRRVSGDKSLQAQEIVIKHDGSYSDETLKSILISYDFDRYSKIQTADEAIPKFLSDVQDTFALLGNLIGLVGIIVSSITIFIVIYINALTRRKFIGILKGIGISEGAIEVSYLLQSIFYALIGIGIGISLLYALFVPFFIQNPIDFPMSNGILVAELFPTILKAGILLIVTMIAGLLPARIIVRQNTLDSILQR